MPAICFFQKRFDRRINRSFRPFFHPDWDKIFAATQNKYIVTSPKYWVERKSNFSPELSLRVVKRVWQRKPLVQFETSSVLMKEKRELMLGDKWSIGKKLEIICFIYSDTAIVHHSWCRRQLSYILWLHPNRYQYYKMHYKIISYNGTHMHVW